jgi:hypothetical protein
MIVMDAMADPMHPDTEVARRLEMEQLSMRTAFLGALLLVGILGEFATLVLGLQRTLPAHILLGVALIPIVALKLGSTGWRMIRYYTKDPATDGKARHARSCAGSRRSSSARPSLCSEVGLD